MEVGLPLTFTIWVMLGWSDLEAYALEACLAYTMGDTISRSVVHVLATKSKGSAQFILLLFIL